MFTIDHRMVSHIAERDYGIIGPVSLSRVKRRRQANGFYNMRRTDNAHVSSYFIERGDGTYVFHRIRVEGSERPPEEVAESIAHELKHAQQTERIIRTTEEEDFVPVLRRYFSAGEYGARTCEVEAREAGRKYGKLILTECFR